MLDKNAIFLGTTSESGPHILGFGGQLETVAGQPIYLDMETPILTIAPTGSGKGVSCIIPTLLTLDLPVIVIDRMLVRLPLGSTRLIELVCK